MSDHASRSAHYNLSVVETALGKKVDALKHLRAALQQADLKVAIRVRAQHDFDEAYAQTGHIAVRTEAGAKVTVDGAK